ncbi:rubredoxin-like domain-containing protein [Halobium palmae]|uniref:Rubredoxin-like domain-containing protein n=1 Tax=Halobium palmae TaxID=1776492 RepID=A0ABD5S1S9_9EURY
MARSESEPRDGFEDLELGETVFDADGTELGSIRGFDDAGFYVRVREDVESLHAESATSADLGRADLMWRCWDCGEMGRIRTLPEECPNCGAGKEELYYWTED